MYNTESKRSNAATVDWSGNAWFAGDVYVGSTSGTNKDEGSKKLATEEYVDNAKDFIILNSSTEGSIKNLKLQLMTLAPLLLLNSVNTLEK